MCTGMRVQRVHRGPDRVADLQHVAQHDRYAGTSPDVRTPAERERHNACVVDAVEQAPQASPMPRHAGPRTPYVSPRRRRVGSPSRNCVPVRGYCPGRRLCEQPVRKAGGFQSARTAPACSSSTISVSRRHVGTNSGMCSAIRRPPPRLGSGRRRPPGATTPAVPGARTVRSARRACRRARPRAHAASVSSIGPGRAAPVAPAPAA